MLKNLLKKASDNHYDTYLLAIGLIFMLFVKVRCVITILTEKYITNG